jgi:hypothetical protein
MGQAFERLLDHVGAAFRPERDEHQSNILTACRLKELVQSHRMTFQQAMEKLEAPRVEEMLWSFEWKKLDNTTLNIEFETAVHTTPAYEREAAEWLRRMAS